jgi:Zn-dependent protease
MIPTERPLDNPINWSFRALRVRGIDVRVHVTFLLGAVVLLWLEMPRAGERPTDPFSHILGDAVATYAILFGIVLLHEFGHCWGARRTGGEADEILLWPLGGLASVKPTHDPRSHLITTLAGPSVNVLICAVCSAVLTLWTGSLGVVPWNPLHPVTPVDSSIFPTFGQEWVLRVYGTSYFLLLINLLPIFPFDGGRIVQACIWSRLGYHRAGQIAATTGMIGAIGIGLAGLFTEESWLFIMIAVFGYATCWQMRISLRDQSGFGSDQFGYDVSNAYLGDGPEARPRRPGLLKRMRMRKAAGRAERERRQREVHAQAVEEILDKVSHSGLASLSPRERGILEEETRRRRAAQGDAP